MIERRLLCRGASVALLAVTAPIAMAKHASATGTNETCVANSGGPSVAVGRCCNAPNQWCQPEWGGDPVWAAYWWPSVEPCPKK